MRTYRDIPGYGGWFQADERGTIRLAEKATNHPYKRKAPGDQISPSFSTDGYLKVNLKRSPGKFTGVHVHRLVALTFLGAPPEAAYQVNHKDCNKLNNHPSNLEWVSQQENLAHAWYNGLRKKPEKPRKITFEQARDIFARAKSGNESLAEIAKDYAVTIHTVSKIRHGRQWKGVSA